jgi:hypothetical protein
MSNYKTYVVYVLIGAAVVWAVSVHYQMGIMQRKLTCIYAIVSGGSAPSAACDRDYVF